MIHRVYVSSATSPCLCKSTHHSILDSVPFQLLIILLLEFFSSLLLLLQFFPLNWIISNSMQTCYKKWLTLKSKQAKQTYLFLFPLQLLPISLLLLWESVSICSHSLLNRLQSGSVSTSPTELLNSRSLTTSILPQLSPNYSTFEKR